MLQSSKFPHADDQTNTGRKFAQLRELDSLAHQLEARAPHVAYFVMQSMAAEINDENYPPAIDEVKKHLAALDDAAISAII